MTISEHKNSIQRGHALQNNSLAASMHLLLIYLRRYNALEVYSILMNEAFFEESYCNNNKKNFYVFSNYVIFNVCKSLVLIKKIFFLVCFLLTLHGLEIFIREAFLNNERAMFEVYKCQLFLIKYIYASPRYYTIAILYTYILSVNGYRV
jgi:hypothetical protein